MAGMGRVAFLDEASRSGVAVIDIDVASKWLSQAPCCSVPKRGIGKFNPDALCHSAFLGNRRLFVTFCTLTFVTRG